MLADMRARDYDLIVKELGYSDSSNYQDLRAPGSGPSLLSLARQAGSLGVYLFQAASHRKQPAVFLASASDDTEARQIRQRLWNHGQAPFIIMVLPDRIVAFDGYGSSDQPLQEIRRENFSSVGALFRQFHATSIDQGLLWENSRLDSKAHVSTVLLDCLKQLAQKLHKTGLSMMVVNKLIGKSIFLRYLRDRSLLTADMLHAQSLDPELCFNSVSQLDKLFDWLNHRFNGSIFPLDFHREGIRDDHLSLVHQALLGERNQQTVLFPLFDFKYIPIVTLSSIYEQFVTMESQSASRKNGIVYTPEFLAELTLDSLEKTRPLKEGMRVLDPACGSGMFLVCVYRRMVETLGQDRHRPSELKRLLQQSIFGVEREPGACMVAELSLVLAFLDFLGERDFHDPMFKLPSLRGSNIIHADFFTKVSDPAWRGSFDWIVGNPPWTDLKKKAAQEEMPFRAWLQGSDKPVGDRRTSEGFLWATLDLLAPLGLVALIVHGKSLTNKRCKKFRELFFQSVRLKYVVNFANMRRNLFAGAVAPAALMVFGPKDTVTGQTFEHFAPKRYNQPFRNSAVLWTLAQKPSECQTIPQAWVTDGNAVVWKAAIWGNAGNHLRNLRVMRQWAPVTLQSLCSSRDWSISEGPQFRALPEGKAVPIIQPLQVLRDARELKSNTFVTPSDLVTLSEGYLRRGKLSKTACQIVVMPDWSRKLFSCLDFVARPRQFAISAALAENEAELRALCLYLHTSLATYFLLFHSADWGMERDRINLENLKALCVPNWTRDHIVALAEDQIAIEKQTVSADELRHYADDCCKRCLGGPQRLWDETREFFDVDFKTNDGKQPQIALAQPSEHEKAAYARQLAEDLDRFIQRADLQHRVVLSEHGQVLRCQITLEPHSLATTGAADGSGLGISDLSERIGPGHTIERDMVFQGNQALIVRRNRRIDWTRWQAGVDAGRCIAGFMEGE